ncbi:MAG TPA: molybdopterin molybdotransferase MoeA [Syntrophomonadaceae bacterium]|nr:molybdopterin molybdotransferase MoeA [Syntrophomonadaceae bacterium]
MLRDVSLEKAQELILEGLSALPAEQVPLSDSLGRVLAEDLLAPEDLPPNPQSAVDGFALGDGQCPIESTFSIQGYLGLGDFTDRTLMSGEAHGVLTGGTLPVGTKAVVPHERTGVQEKVLTVLEPIKPGNNIKKAGEDFSTGQLLVAKGDTLDPGALAVLAAFGIGQIPVHRKPRVALISLGHNIIAWDQNPQLGQTRDSNAPLLAALVKQQGGLVVACQQAQDSGASINLIKELLKDVDLLISTGGTYTQGDIDVHRAWESLGAKMLYWGAALMPGSHTGAARMGSQLLLALSGNPGGCAVGYQLLASPVLRAMQGRNPAAMRVSACCINGFNKKSGSRRFVRGHAVYTGRGWEVSALPGQKPSMLRSLISCNALIDVPSGSSELEPGASVAILLLE